MISTQQKMKSEWLKSQCWQTKRQEIFSWEKKVQARREKKKKKNCIFCVSAVLKIFPNNIFMKIISIELNIFNTKKGG